MAACLGVSPASRCLAMFSTSTIASSTMIPIIIAKARRVIVSRLNPNIAMTIQVPNREIGIAKAVIMVAGKFRKNGKMTATARIIANSRASIVAWVAS